MSLQENLTADLFEVDKRLSLKPVVDFNNYLLNAFGEGACACSRCQQGSGDETGYAHQHTFSFNGLLVNRRFASTAGSDVLIMLKKAWLSYTKAELGTAGALDLEAVKAFVEPQLHVRVLPLFLASGLVREQDGEWLMQAQVA
ncbi:hypothetical protein DCO48_20395 [Pseudomonas sp. SDI]|uniref:hypothetical protein n=1 Tax=Pseudomonas sp. SDI TaxID=2170734 RepID=UPI000DE71F4F|nr:hypothetical protein [Pseudomonas sp. SDI]PWB30424.1 hypothetical protein DCO48_20395 [Pseudomonas sp. SDI]